MRKSLLIAAAIVSVVAFTGCKGKNKTVTGGGDEAVSVKIEQSYKEKVAQSVDFTANLEAYKQTYIVPSITARIEKLNVDVGDKVKKGQILAEMDKTQYNTNALQLANAELDFARMKPVYETGGISKQEIDAAETNINVLKETVSNLEENVTQSVRRRGNGALQRGGRPLLLDERHGYLSSDADEPAQGVRLRVGAVFSAGLYRDAGRGESGRLSGPGILR